MSRLYRALLLPGSLLCFVAMVGPAYAQSYPPSVTPVPSLAGGGGSNTNLGTGGGAGDTAFTGGDTLVIGAIVSILVVAGLAALWAARKQRA